MTPEQEKLAETFISALKSNGGQPINWREFTSEGSTKPIMSIVVSALKEPDLNLIKENATGSSMMLLTEKGWAFTSFKLLKSSTKEKEDLELQKLRSENILLVQQLADFPKLKADRKNIFIVAIIELLIILAGLFLQWKCLT